jgi:hypothetical protein
MSANAFAAEVPIQRPEHTAIPASRTLRLALAGGLLAAAAQFGIMREFPAVYGPPDAIALVTFGRALVEQLPAESTFSAVPRPSFALRGHGLEGPTH